MDGKGKSLKALPSTMNLYWYTPGGSIFTIANSRLPLRCRACRDCRVTGPGNNVRRSPRPRLALDGSRNEESKIGDVTCVASIAKATSQGGA